MMPADEISDNFFFITICVKKAGKPAESVSHRQVSAAANSQGKYSSSLLALLVTGACPARFFSFFFLVSLLLVLVRKLWRSKRICACAAPEAASRHLRWRYKLDHRAAGRVQESLRFLFASARKLAASSAGRGDERRSSSHLRCIGRPGTAQTSPAG